MDKINYLSNSTTAQNGKYPVTIQGLDFIQKQLLLLQNCTLIGGDDVYIIRNSQRYVPGICVIRGEILPITNVRSVKSTHLQVTTQTESVTTDSGVYTDIREVRTAQWVVNNDPELETGIMIPRNKIGELKSNSFLWSKIQEITGNMYASLPITIGRVTMEQLGACKSAMRLICLSGSEAVFDHNSYCVDVSPTLDTGGGKVTQILTSADGRRYCRTYDSQPNKWTDFVPVDGQMTIEAKVIKGVLFVRHGYLPDNANLIILRKKRRNSNAGVNRPQRSVKCAWYHGWKMVISKGTPNKWYVPFVKSTDKKFTAQVGQPVQSALQNLLYIWYDNNGVSRWRIAGVNKKWSTAKRGYAKLAIAVVQSDKHNITIDNMAGLKFRVANRVNGFIDKSLSVE